MEISTKLPLVKWQFGGSLVAVSLNLQLTSGSLVEISTKLPLVKWQFGGSLVAVLVAVWWQFGGSLMEV